MLDKIEALRERPKQVRTAYAFWISFGITLCIALVWGYSFSKRINGDVQPEVIVEQKDVPSSLSRFLDTTGERVGAMIASFKKETVYQKEENTVVTPSNTLDLNAMVASSSMKKQKEKMQERFGTSSADSL